MTALSDFGYVISNQVFTEVLEKEHELKRQFFDVHSPRMSEPTRRMSTPTSAEKKRRDENLLLLEGSAQLLELTLSAGSVFEAARVLGFGSETDLEEEKARRVLALAKSLCGLNIQQVIGRLPTEVIRLAEQQTSDRTLIVSFKLFWPIARGTAESCPVKYLESLARFMKEDALGHRIRFAYDKLKAFVHRNDSEPDAKINVMGRLYVEGRLHVQEVADLLNIDVQDVLALFDQRGFARPISTIRLTDEERSAFAARISKRVGQQPNLDFDERLISRDIVATQRIEGVDARLWMKPQ